jgi:tetratricopeptide (TPR) repeat protein
LQIDPDDEQAYNNRGLAEQAQGDLDSALFDFNRALQIAPTYAQARTNRAWAEYRDGDWIGAMRDLW